MTQTRMTVQKVKILNFMRKARNHPCAEEVYEEIIKEIPHITLATVYRNLNILSEQGLIEKIKVNLRWRYDGHKSTHAHAVCVNCRKIIDVEACDTSKKLLDETKIKGFKAETVNLIFRGICSDCKKN